MTGLRVEPLYAARGRRERGGGTRRRALAGGAAHRPSRPADGQCPGAAGCRKRRQRPCAGVRRRAGRPRLWRGHRKYRRSRSRAYRRDARFDLAAARNRPLRRPPGGDADDRVGRATQARSGDAGDRFRPRSPRRHGPHWTRAAALARTVATRRRHRQGFAGEGFQPSASAARRRTRGARSRRHRSAGARLRGGQWRRLSAPARDSRIYPRRSAPPHVVPDGHRRRPVRDPRQIPRAAQTVGARRTGERLDAATTHTSPPRPRGA